MVALTTFRWFEVAKLLSLFGGLPSQNVKCHVMDINEQRLLIN
jgi:hypothetical protein